MSINRFVDRWDVTREMVMSEKIAMKAVCKTSVQNIQMQGASPVEAWKT